MMKMGVVVLTALLTGCAGLFPKPYVEITETNPATGVVTTAKLTEDAYIVQKMLNFQAATKTVPQSASQSCNLSFDQLQQLKAAGQAEYMRSCRDEKIFSAFSEGMRYAARMPAPENEAVAKIAAFMESKEKELSRRSLSRHKMFGGIASVGIGAWAITDVASTIANASGVHNNTINTGPQTTAPSRTVAPAAAVEGELPTTAPPPGQDFYGADTVVVLGNRNVTATAGRDAAAGAATKQVLPLGGGTISGNQPLLNDPDTFQDINADIGFQ